MISPLAAELLKLRTLRSTWGVVLVAILFAGLTTAGNIGGSSEFDRLDPELQFRMMLDAAFPAAILALLTGIVLFTSEFRHGTIARTLLATPSRLRLVGIKLVTGGINGGLLMLLTIAVVLTTSTIWLKALDVPLAFDEAVAGAWRGLAVVALAGVLGAAIGGAVHAQVAALVGTLVWMFVLEPICWVILGLLDADGVAEYLPAAALGSAFDPEGGGSSWARSVAVGLAWTALAATLAGVRTHHRDIT